MDDKLMLTKEKLMEILSQSDDDELMELYYQKALTGNIEAYEKMAIVCFLFVIIRYKRRSMLGENLNPFHFFGVPQQDFKKYYELLERANQEIFECFVANEKIPDEPLIEFSEDFAFVTFWQGNYFESLRYCENALKRDSSSFMCNFIKASIIELCFVNATNDGYKVQLLNYQKQLIDRCDKSKLNFNKDIYEKVVKNIETNYETLDKSLYKVKFKPAQDDFEKVKLELPEWTREHDFCLRHKLYLNPLCDFDLFLESSLEELEKLSIEEQHQNTFNEIVEEFKLCRHLTFEYCQNISNDTKRVQCMVFCYAYSIFDKLAFLFRDIYDLDVGDDKVDFTQNNLFDRKFNTIDMCFKSVKNNNIYPLYCLMQKVRSKQKITDSIKTIVFNFNELRNTIEHRTIQEIDEYMLEVHSIYLLRRLREALLYTYMLLSSFSGKTGTHTNTTALKTTYVKAIVELAQESQNIEVNTNDKL